MPDPTIDLTPTAGALARELYALDTAGHWPTEKVMAAARHEWDTATPGSRASRARASYLERGLALARIACYPIAAQAWRHCEGSVSVMGIADFPDNPYEQGGE